MPARNRYAQYVLWLHFVVAEVFAVALLVQAGRVSEWLDWVPFDPTMTKMLAAALASLGVGSLLAARDPLRNRVIIQTEIVYTALSAVVVLYRLLRFSDTTPDFAWVVFAVFVVLCALFCVTYPSAASSGDEAAVAGEASSSDV